MKAENVEAITLWRYNKLQEWLMKKTFDERYQLMVQARSLISSIRPMNAKNAEKVQAYLEREFCHISDEKKKDDRLSMRYCNLITSDEKTFLPYSSEQLDEKRRQFNKEICQP